MRVGRGDGVSRVIGRCVSIIGQVCVGSKGVLCGCGGVIVWYSWKVVVVEGSGRERACVCGVVMVVVVVVVVVVEWS